MKGQRLLFSVESVFDTHPLDSFKILFANLKTITSIQLTLPQENPPFAKAS